jgi:hypothetical protein
MRSREAATAGAPRPQILGHFAERTHGLIHWAPNGALYHVDAITRPAGGGRRAISAYERLDPGVTWPAHPDAGVGRVRAEPARKPAFRVGEPGVRPPHPSAARAEMPRHLAVPSHRVEATIFIA